MLVVLFEVEVRGRRDHQMHRFIGNPAEFPGVAEIKRVFRGWAAVNLRLRNAGGVGSGSVRSVGGGDGHVGSDSVQRLDHMGSKTRAPESWEDSQPVWVHLFGRVRCQRGQQPWLQRTDYS